VSSRKQARIDRKLALIKREQAKGSDTPVVKKNS
jgi:hypothetical protein